MIKQSVLGLAMVVCVALFGHECASAITVGPFGPNGEGGDKNGQSFLIGTGGQVHELDGFVYVQGLDLNGNLLGTTAQLSRDPLPANLSFQFSFALSPDAADISLLYSFTNTGNTTFSDVRFFVFLDAEIDETMNTLFNEFGTVQGSPGPGGGDPAPNQWQIDEPGFQTGNLVRNLYLGTLNDSNSVPQTALNDVAMGLGFSLGNLGPGAGTTVRVMISQAQHVSGNFALGQHDSDPASTTVITLSGLLGQAVTAQLSGTVFRDVNTNGLPDAGEGLGGVVLLLQSNQVTLAQATTDSGGRYSFTNAPGNYTLSLNTSSVPPGLLLVPVQSGATNNPSNVDLTPAGLTTVNWGFAPPPVGVVSGTVFRDINGNGLPDAGESLAGAVLLLQSNQVTLAQATTDTGGRYSFTNAPGNYTLSLDTSSLPPGLLLIPVQSGATNNPWSLALTANGSITVNWGFAPPPAGVVNGTVFKDNNNNGLPDASESLAGAVLLLQSNKVTLAQATTDNNGRYSFTNAPGTYTLSLNTSSLPPGLLLIPVQLGATTNPSSVALTANNLTIVNWGFAAPPAGVVSGTVFRDNDSNGLPDNGESLSGVVLLLQSNQVTLAQATTDNNGRYSFTNAPGNYTLSLNASSLPAGLLLIPVQSGATNNPWSVALTPNGSTTVNWGFAAPPVGVVSGTVFRDNNSNGLPDNGESLSGVVLLLQSNQVTLAQTTTDVSGQYSFTNAPGNYTLSLNSSSLPPALLLVPVQSGATNNPWSVALTANAVTNVNWGFAPPPLGAVIGTVFQDVNTNGIADTGEALGGVRLLLRSNQVTIAQSTTDVSGRYTFTNAPGNYTLQLDTSSLPGGVAPIQVQSGATNNPWSVNLTANVATTVNWGFIGSTGVVFENVNPLLAYGLTWQLNRARGTLVGTLVLTNLPGSGATLSSPWQLGMQASADFFYPTNFGVAVGQLPDGVASIDLSAAIAAQAGQGQLTSGQQIILTNVVEIYSHSRSAPLNSQFEVWASR